MPPGFLIFLNPSVKNRYAKQNGNYQMGVFLSTAMPTINSGVRSTELTQARSQLKRAYFPGSQDVRGHVFMVVSLEQQSLKNSQLLRRG